jgi:putative transposase
MIERCRDAFAVRMMCACLNVSPSGFYGWRDRPPSQRTRDNQRLLERIEAHHVESDGAMGAPRICQELRYEGETASLNRVARLMRSAGLVGIPQRRQWRRKQPEKRP